MTSTSLNLPNVPRHLSEQNARMYESAILEVLSLWPNQVEIRRPGMQPTTVCARFRDAIRSFLLYRWPSKIDLTKLSEVRMLMAVWIDGTRVLAGPKDREAREQVSDVVAAAKLSAHVFEVDKVEVLNALCVLVGERQLESATIHVLPGRTFHCPKGEEPEMWVSLQGYIPRCGYDVALAQGGAPDTYIIV